jgi:NCAIR mutase (PurE)-related protein
MSVRYDHDRYDRVGLPEAVLYVCKTDDHLRAVVRALCDWPPTPVLFSRMAADRVVVVETAARHEIDFDADSGTTFLHWTQRPRIGSELPWVSRRLWNEDSVLEQGTASSCPEPGSIQRS